MRPLLPLSRIPSRLILALALLGSLSSCGDDGGPTGPDTSQMEILVLGGEGQIAEPGALLPTPLEVRVQAMSNGRVEGGVEVRWEVVAGGRAKVDHETTVTDSAGVTSVRLTLGAELGEYRVQASVKGMTASPAEFRARAIVSPELTVIPSGSVQAGDIIQLEGRNLSQDPAENVVTFSKIRGRVISASATTLEVEVPPCLPSRSVLLQLQIGALATEPVALQVLEGNEYLSLEVGEDRILDASDALACFRLPSSPGSSFLLVPHTTGTVGGAEYPVVVTGLTEDGLFPTSQFSSAGSIPSPQGEVHQTEVGGPIPSTHWEWEYRLRALERALVREKGTEGRGEFREGPAPGLTPQATPEVGDTRKFKVLNPEKTFDDIIARVHYITEHSLIYVDEETPAGGFTDQDLAFLAEQFEDPIHPTVTGVFGLESDLDSNGRVVILFTPGVNRLTPPGSDGYVGGFFFGVDLLTDRTGSNKGEIFYAVVPDPTGAHGPSLSRTTLLSSIPAILAHEFEHMVHFNQRILVAGAADQDALWLSEALAQMAEDLVGMAYEGMGDPVRALDYQLGNWSRARRFLLDPSQVSVLATLPPGTLAERGAGWVLLKHLYGRDGQNDLLRTLTGSKRTGVENITSAIGRDWGDIVSDWVGSLYLDGVEVPVRSGLRVLGVNLRSVLARFDGTYPLSPPSVGGASFSISGSLWSSAPDYYILTTPEVGGVALNVSGPNGRPPYPPSGLRILVVRLQ